MRAKCESTVRVRGAGWMNGGPGMRRGRREKGGSAERSACAAGGKGGRTVDDGDDAAQVVGRRGAERGRARHGRLVRHEHPVRVRCRGNHGERSGAAARGDDVLARSFCMV